MSTKFLALAAIALLFCGVRGMDDLTATDDLLGDSEVKGDWTSIADLVDSKNGTGTLWTAVMEALNAGELEDLADALTSGNTTATVFAPTDEAFAMLGEGVLDSLLADPAKLADILRYHVVVGDALTLADIKAMDGMLLTTALEGPAGQLKIRQGGKKAALLTTNGADVPIYQYNMKAGNAIVHSIKQVLVPGSMVLTAGTDAPAPTMAM